MTSFVFRLVALLAALPDAGVASLEGRVVDEQGKAVDGALVSAVVSGSPQIDHPTPRVLFGCCDALVTMARMAVKDATSVRALTDGRFILPLPAGDSWDIRIQAAGFLLRDLREVRPGSALTVLLKHGARVTGRAIRAGSPVVDASVFLQPLGSDLRLPYAAFPVATDSDGGFAFQGAAPGEQFLTVQGRTAGSYWSHSSLMRVEGEKGVSLDVRLEKEDDLRAVFSEWNHRDAGTVPAR